MPNRNEPSFLNRFPENREMSGGGNLEFSEVGDLWRILTTLTAVRSCGIISMSEGVSTRNEVLGFCQVCETVDSLLLERRKKERPRRPTTNASKPWITGHLINLIRQNDCLFTKFRYDTEDPLLITSHQYLRNPITALRRELKLEHDGKLPTNCLSTCKSH